MGLVGTMSVVYPGCMHLFGYLIVIAVAYAATAAADVYRSKDADGNVIYSDEAGPGAEKVELRDPTILPAEPLPSRTSASKTPNPKQSAKPYDTFERRGSEGSSSYRSGNRNGGGLWRRK